LATYIIVHSVQVLGITSLSHDSESDGPEACDEDYMYMNTNVRHCHLENSARQNQEDQNQQVQTSSLATSTSALSAPPVSSVGPDKDFNPCDPIVPWRSAVEDALFQLSSSSTAFASTSGPEQREALSDLMRHATALGAHIEYMRKQPHSTR
jgi:hypothetical protein